MTKELTAFQKIWTNCRAALQIRSDEAKDDWLDAKFSARNSPFDSNTATGDALEQVILAGLKDERIFEQAVQAHEEFLSAQGFYHALIGFCTEMGHEFYTDSDGDVMCRFCGIGAENAGPSTCEEIWEEVDEDEDGDDSYRRGMLPQPPHPLAG